TSRVDDAVLEGKPHGIKLIGDPHLFGLRPTPRLEIASEINVRDSDIQIHIPWDGFLAHLLHELCNGIEDGFGFVLEFFTSCVVEYFRIHKDEVNSCNVFRLLRGHCVTQTVQSGNEQGLAKYSERKMVHGG